MTAFHTLAAARSLQNAAIDSKHADAIVDAMRVAISD